ncbi:MAG TPA: hypothetical protein VLM79_23045 [Kofleriaceae bacterium]|nr:hypothetical protein [Kofleriaceae bacterium]
MLITIAVVPNARAIRSAAPSERFVVTAAIVMTIQIALATSTVLRDIAARVAAQAGSRSVDARRHESMQPAGLPPL